MLIKSWNEEGIARCEIYENEGIFGEMKINCWFSGEFGIHVVNLLVIWLAHHRVITKDTKMVATMLGAK